MPQYNPELVDALKSEHKDLKYRLAALTAFFGTDGFAKLDIEHQHLLNLQHSYMRSYLGVLSARLELLAPDEVDYDLDRDGPPEFFA